MCNARTFMKAYIPIVATRHNAEMKKKYKKADLAIGVSKETMNFLNAKQNILIENGTPFKKPKKISLSNKFNIIGIGRLAKVKGWDLLIKALAQVKFDFELILLGEGTEKYNLQRLCNELNIQDKVYFKGFVTNVNDYIFSSDMQIIASIEEGLSIALIEGIFYSKLLIASDIANHKEILGDELVFNRDEKILAKKLTEIYENYDKFVHIFAKIKETKEQYSIKTMAQKYLKAYESVIKNEPLGT
ncbi:glycosyltransferase [Campylobacter sp. faydin G-105]|uniref:glycosyltransferase n=1 Tax=Campylobacter anatolicus TaxID=2829105 RepID=UPI001B9F6E63|nr:glycosyltransferase [Campylobacter anatolicus]MBR8461687.1 glycosyltransferase [Campylobacter anatolicus]